MFGALGSRGPPPRPQSLNCCQQGATSSHGAVALREAYAICRNNRAVVPTAMTTRAPASTWTVEDMLSSLRNAQRLDPQAGALWDQHEAAGASVLELAKQTLVTLGYSVPLQSGIRDSFCEEGGLEAVLQLLPHPELQYLALSALVALLGTWQGNDRRDAAAEAAARLGVTEALLPLLAPGGSWVVQGRCCGVFTLLVRQELRTQDAQQDRLRRGVRWQLLNGGGIAALTSLLHSSSKEAGHQASTTLAMLCRFRGAYQAALLTETAVLPSLVQSLTASPQNMQLEPAAAVIALCDTDSPALQEQVIASGAVHALMQMQSLAYTGPFRDPARKRLKALAAAFPAARQQILNTTAVIQPEDTQPAQWSAWWRQLKADVGIA